MIITNATKQLFIVSLFAAIVSGGALGYFLYTIDKQSTILDESIVVIKEGERRQETELRTKRIFNDSKNDRDALWGVVFPDATDSIVDFVSNLETFAPQVGIDFTVVSFGAETPIKNIPGATEMKLQFSYKGSKKNVIDFSRLLESVGNVSRLDSLTLTNATDDDWQAQATMVVMIRTI